MSNGFRLVGDLAILEGEKVRLLHEFKESAWVIRIDDAKAMPIKCNGKDLEIYECEKDIEQKLFLIGELNRLCPHSKSIYEKNVALVHKIMNHGPKIFDAKYRSSVINELVENGEASKPTLYKLIKTFWCSGCDSHSLIPSYFNCGKKESADESAPRGVKPKYYATYILRPEEQAKIVKLIERDFLVPNGPTFASFYYTLLCKTHPKNVELANQGILELMGNVPSYGQVRYLLEKHFPADVIQKKKAGDKTFERDMALHTGSAAGSTAQSGLVYEIDSTICEVNIVHSEYRNYIIGKATLYVLVCRKSKLIVTFHLSLNAPCWDEASEAIAGLANSMEERCKKYGIEFNPEDWPAEGIKPREIVADLGPEFTGKASDLLPKELNISLTNTPSQQAHRKGTIESTFHQTHVAIFSKVDGQVRDVDSRKRQREKREFEANLTLHELDKVLLMSAIMQNRKCIKTNDYPIEEVLKGNVITRISLFNYSLRNEMGVPTRFREGEARMKLLRQGEGTLTRQGIRFNNLEYSVGPSNENYQNLSSFVASLNGSQRKASPKVAVRYSGQCVNSIWVEHPGIKTVPVQLFLNEAYRQFKDMSFAEHEIVHKQLNENNKKNESATLELQVTFTKETDEITKNARERKAQFPKVSADKQKKLKPEMRKDEQRTQRTKNPLFVSPDNFQSGDSKQKYGENQRSETRIEAEDVQFTELPLVSTVDNSPITPKKKKNSLAAWAKNNKPGVTNAN
ncbi:MAG: hypothetical protein CMN89_08080 [Sutterellaceae bacterium]|uniref:hypothetical protein n=1 Tax=unclassified Limnobacter TaxID=2630203 RepID=UPI000C5CB001|nr:MULTISPECIES: hypothetical protein [unclassified Limnobacter]MAG81922.1 hypothetical protein [Sutterellaceae bacterium]MBT84426.1 hypothetical protein [Sutterellaceae bacterium]|tara:strand:+ start:16741 stop:18963 length:2223 start_codon:yes stop_codon:yes gene_type:complete